MPSIACSLETAGRGGAEKHNCRQRPEASHELHEAVPVPGNARGAGFQEWERYQAWSC